jgi:uroporphyrinogen-III decarboxylase
MKSTGYNLMLSAIYNGRKGDRPPGGSPTSVVCKGLMDACGVWFPQAHVDAQAMAEALAGHEILGFDNVMPEYSVHQESAAIGCQVDWGDRDTMPVACTRRLCQGAVPGRRRRCMPCRPCDRRPGRPPALRGTPAADS